jgi:hypothetical protein
LPWLQICADFAAVPLLSLAAHLVRLCSNSPERERPGLPPSPGKRRLGGGGGGNGGSRSSSPLKRHGSGFASSFRSRAGGGSGADPGALPAALQAGIIAPPLPRADWPLVTPVVQAR